MSLKFSKVALTCGEKTTSLLAGGAPRSAADLHGWTAFHGFMESIGNDGTVTAHIETFLYGGDDAVDATPEEVAYIYKRVEMRPDFIEKRTEKCSEYDLILRI